jgi:hypothetical protein
MWLGIKNVIRANHMISLITSSTTDPMSILAKYNKIHIKINKICGKVCQWLPTGLWFSPGTPISSTNKTDRHDITEILLKVALNTITPNT